MSTPSDYVPQPTVRAGEVATPRFAARERLVRRVAISAMGAFLLAGLLGAFGYRSASQATVNGPYEVTLTYPTVTRGGLPTHWSLEVSTRDASALPALEVRTTSSWFRLLDHNGLDPEPDAVWTNDERVWTYDPEGQTALTIDLDARTQPNARWRHHATTTVVAGGTEIAAFDYSTVVVP